MTRISLVAAVTAVAAWGNLQSGGASSNGIWVQYETKLEPSSPPLINQGGGTLTENNIIKRHLCNFSNKTYIGYDLTAERTEDGRYKLRIAPLTITPAKMDDIFRESPGWSQLPLPAQPVTQIVRAGETIAFDLLVNPSTGQKVVEYLSVKGNDRQVVTIKGPARDFTPADAEIAIIAPRLSINRQPYKGTENFNGGITGNAVWIDVGGHGRFVFSLFPRQDLGIQRAGEIRGTTMTWRSGSDTYTITTDRPITTGSGAYNLYVFHDPSYRPPGEHPAGEWMGMSAGPTLDAAFRRK